METVKIAFNALFVHKLRSLLTVLGIVIGVAAVILLVSIGNGLSSVVTQQFEELGTDLLMVMPGKVKFGDSAGREGGPPGASNNKLTIKYVHDIDRRSRHVVATVPVATSYAAVKFNGKERTTGVLGTTANYDEIRKSPLTYGAFFDDSDVQGGRKVAVLGQTVIDDLKMPANPVGQSIKIAGQTFRIVGILEEKGASFGNDQDDLIAIPYTTFERVFNLDKISYIYAKVGDVANMELAKNEIKEIFLTRKLKEEDFSLVDPKELFNTVSSILGALTTALGGIAAISLIVGGIGVANIMLVSVTERTREIGLRKAVGARQRDILYQFLAESILLSVTGGLIGILLGVTFSFILNHFFQTSITAWSIIMAFTVSCLVGITSGMGPAIKASRKNPIEALRYE